MGLSAAKDLKQGGIAVNNMYDRSIKDSFEAQGIQEIGEKNDVTASIPVASRA